MPQTPQDDYYELLGVSPDASFGAIKKAYRRQVRKYHPDKHDGHELAELAKERLAAINQAYDTLKDPERRREYDRQVGRTGPTSWAPSGVRGQGASRPRFLRVMFWMLGIAGFGILMRYLRNPRVWLVVAVLTAVIWFFTRRPTPPED